VNVAVVTRTHGRLAWREVWFAGRLRRGFMPLVLSLLTLLAFGGGSLALFAAIARAHAPVEWSERVLAWAFTLAFLLLALGDLQASLDALVAEPDLERLRAAPITARQLLGIKLLETLPRTLSPLLTIALPVALAYARVVGGVNPLALVVALFTLWAVPLGLGLALALPLLRAAPAARIRESLAVLATFAFVAGWLVNAFWIPRLASDGAVLTAGLRALPAPPAWSPATWAARAATADGRTALESAGGCVLAAIAALGLALVAATQLLAGVEAQAAAVSGRRVRASARRERTLAGAFLRRDAALVTRDWPILLDTLASVALWSLLPLAVLPVAPLPRLELARNMLIMLSVSLGHDVAARALPLERAALAWARLSPVGGARWVRLRLPGVCSVSGALLLGAAALVCAVFGLQGREVLDVLAFGLAAVTSASGTGLLVGAAMGDSAWTNPRAMLGPGGRNVSVWGLLLQAGVWLVVSHRVSAAEPLPPGVLLLLVAAGGTFALLMLGFAARVVERREPGAGGPARTG
jgi:hypothetical protein